MKKIALYASIVFLFSACQPATPTPTPTDTPTLTYTPSPTLTLTPTNSPIPLVNLEGILFFDYNGSGLREENEPPISNFKVFYRQKIFV